MCLISNSTRGWIQEYLHAAAAVLRPPTGNPDHWVVYVGIDESVSEGLQHVASSVIGVEARSEQPRNGDLDVM